MSWLRTAVNRAVEAGGNNLTRTVRSYADSVVQHAGSAVAEGARLFQERISARNFQSFRHTVKRLEEVSVSCKGQERVQLLRRWLVSLKEIERLSAGYPDSSSNNNNKNKINNNDGDDEDNAGDQFSFEESKDSPKRPTLVYYIDTEIGGEPMNFRDVFLYSQALEGITLSMILEAPNEEEVSLLLEIFRLCLAGGKDVHSSVMSSIQALATTFSDYQEEVLVKREELLQYAQAAIAGLKINANLARIDAEACNIVEKLGKMKEFQQPSNEDQGKSSEEPTAKTIEALKEELGQVQLYSRLEALLLKKKSLRNGDSPKFHAEKVDKLKVLAESLLNSTSKAEKRILDNRFQKEEALNFRVTKSNEVSQLEKELAAEIGGLEKQKDDLEAELKKVNSSLTVARARLRNAREEREQFDEASNQIMLHLKSKEDELSRSITCCRIEANVVHAWVHFLEDSWVLQTSYTEQNEKQVSGELERYGDCFVKVAIRLLSAYKEQLGPLIARIRTLAENFSNKGSETEAKDENSKAPNPRKNVEEYLDLEGKVSMTLSIVDTMKKQFYPPNEGIHRKDDQKVKELLDAIDNIKKEFESIERPNLEVETPTSISDSPSSAKSLSSSWTPRALRRNKDEQNKSFSRLGKQANAESEKIKYDFGAEGGDHSEEETDQEIGEWEFDAFEKDLKASS